MVINDSLKINTNFIKRTFKDTLDKNINDNLYYLDKYGNDVLNKEQKNIIKKNIIKDFLNEIDYNLYLSIERNYCVYRFQKGKRYGEYCGRKIYIKNGNNIHLFCSRHNTSYIINPRNYEKRKQCEYIRNNGLQCKNHIKYNNFCFIHKHHNNKVDAFIKLNELRNKYYQNIKKRRKKRIKNNFEQNNKNNKNTFHKNNKRFIYNNNNLYIGDSIYNICQLQNFFKIRKKKLKYVRKETFHSKFFLRTLPLCGSLPRS